MNCVIHYMLKDFKTHLLEKPRKRVLIGFIIGYTFWVILWAMTNVYILVGIVILLYAVWGIDAYWNCLKGSRKMKAKIDTFDPPT